MTIKDLQLILDGVVGNLPIVIVGADGTEAEAENIIATIDPKRIEIKTEAKFPIYDRDKPMKIISNEYKYVYKNLTINRCPVCDNQLRAKAKYCDVCGQALER